MAGAGCLRLPGRPLAHERAPARRYGIDMVLEFRTQGATQYGTITKSRFNSILTTTFGTEKNFFWDDAKLNLLNTHYGTGSTDIALGGKKQVGETLASRRGGEPHRLPTGRAGLAWWRVEGWAGSHERRAAAPSGRAPAAR